MTFIEWTHAPGFKGQTWNPVRARNKETGGVGHFCVHVSPGCENCYAERMQRRFKNPVRYAAQDREKVDIYLDDDVLTKPLGWRKPRMVFVCSMTDLFGDWVETEWLDKIFAVMALCPQHTFQVLTKRPERMGSYISDPYGPDRIYIELKSLAETYVDVFCDWLVTSSGAQRQHDETISALLYDKQPRIIATKKILGWPLESVWLGVSVEDQARADERIPTLLETPAAVRFVSYEPALGPVDFREWIPQFDCGHPADETCRRCEVEILDWIIIGGESGPKARPFFTRWARSVIQQCKAAGVACFVKQLGSNPFDGYLSFEFMPLELTDPKGGDMTEWPDNDLRVRDWPK